MFRYNDFFHRGGFGSEKLDKCFTKLGEAAEGQSKKEQKLEKEEEKFVGEKSSRGTLWHFLESECDPEERELVRDFLLPTAAALALSLPQVRLAYHLFFSMQYCELEMMTDNSF